MKKQDEKNNKDVGPSTSKEAETQRRKLSREGTGATKKADENEKTRSVLKKHVIVPDEQGEHTRKHSHDRASVISSATLVSHALREVVSDHIMAGPHGALLPLTSQRTLDRVESMVSLHTMLRYSLGDGMEFPVLFDDALLEAGSGCFQHKLMALCGFIYSCCSLSSTTLSFVLPAAQWDFQLRSVDKGVLITAPLWGMVVGAYIWGNFADSKGRRFVLFYCLLIDALASFLSSLCQTYTLFFICRIFNGFGIIGATSIVFAYLGEFLSSFKRDHYLSRLEMFWTLGIVTLPIIGFAILPRDWEIGNPDVFIYNSWRIFVFTCGLPSLLAALLMLRMPESPSFLFLQGHHDKARDVLVRMFVSNTGNRPEDFPVTVIHDHEESEYYFTKLHGASRWVKAKAIAKGVYKQHRDLLRGRSLFNILVTCFIDFGLMSVYYTIMLWVPELLHRQDQFMLIYPDKRAPLCVVAGENFEEEGKETVDYFTLIHTFIICLACLPSNIMLLCVIQYVSKKALLVALLLGAAGPTFALYFMGSVFEVTTMLCLFEAVSTLVEAVLFCAIVEIFPLSTRGSALSLTVTVGRLGAVIGNIIFGLNIDNNCRELFFGMSGVLVMSGLAALLLPKMSLGH